MATHLVQPSGPKTSWPKQNLLITSESLHSGWIPAALFDYKLRWWNPVASTHSAVQMLPHVVTMFTLIAPLIAFAMLGTATALLFAMYWRKNACSKRGEKV